MAFLSEAALEDALLAQFEGLGYSRVSDDEIGPDGKHPERESHDEVILTKRLAAAVQTALQQAEVLSSGWSVLRCAGKSGATN